jgi:Uma2 family endonuclease
MAGVLDRPTARPRLAGPLYPGDHIADRREFHRLYEQMPGVRAELVGGVVYMPSPVSTRHCELTDLVTVWLWGYREATPQVRAAAGPTIFLRPDSEPQPDACLYLLPEYGGAARREGEYLAGPPELMVEVALSTYSYDLHAKKDDYRRAGVREYVVVMPEAVEWFVLRDGEYEPVPAPPDGVFRSAFFPGLWLDAPALLRVDPAGIRLTLEAGLATPEHAQFTAAAGA